MLSRLLAALALFTGFAAIGIPVDARALTAATQQVDDQNGAVQSGQPIPCPTSTQRFAVSGKALPQPRCRPRKPIIIYIPTVQFGADRARE